MFTLIWVFLLCSWKIKTLFLKLEDQKDYAALMHDNTGVSWSSSINVKKINQ